MKRNLLRNNIYTVLIITLCMLVCTGCKTKERFYVNAPVGTEIYTIGESLSTANRTPIGVSNSTSAELEVTSNACYELMLAKTPDFPYYIPFGLDFKHRNVAGAKFAKGFGMTLTGIGAATFLVGTVVAIVDKETPTGGFIMAAGGGVTGLGMAMGIPADNRLHQTAYEYEFSYDRFQSPELSGLSATLLHPDKEKGVIENTISTSKRGKAYTVSPDASSAGTNGSQKAKTRKSAAKLLAGEYTGSGELKIGNRTEEIIPNIQIFVEEVDRENVSIRIVEEGEDFFDKPQVCNVVKDKNGDYLLIVANMPNIKISINSKKQISYYNPKVEIDGDADSTCKCKIKQ